LQRIFKSAFLLLVFFLSLNSTILSQGNPIQLALFNPIQIVPEGESVNGIRLNLDMGLVNQTTGSQLGVQWGGVNLTDGGFTGWQAGFLNISMGSSVGLQSSWVNYHSGNFNGLQLALVNYSATLKGLQLGLINIIGEGGFLPVFPIFNFDFD